MARGLYEVTPEKLAEALRLPDSALVVGASWNAMTNCLVLSIEDKALPYGTPNGTLAPHIRLVLSSEWQ